MAAVVQEWAAHCSIKGSSRLNRPRLSATLLLADRVVMSTVMGAVAELARTLLLAIMAVALVVDGIATAILARAEHQATQAAAVLLATVESAETL